MQMQTAERSTRAARDDARAAAKSRRRWICKDCGAVHAGDEPCGRCAAGRRLAAALARIEEMDDDRAVNAAAEAVEDAIYDLREQRWIAGRDRERLARRRFRT